MLSDDTIKLSNLSGKNQLSLIVNYNRKMQKCLGCYRDLMLMWNPCNHMTNSK